MSVAIFLPKLIRYLGGKGAMTPKEVRKAETESEICDLLEVRACPCELPGRDRNEPISHSAPYPSQAGLAQTQQCRTEQQRVEHHIGLAFVSPSRYLREVWTNRESVLPAGAKVTVELSDASVPGSIVPGVGSFSATVENGPDQAGEYIVRRSSDDEQMMVPRRLLRQHKDGGFIRRIGERLNVHWGTRNGRPYAFDQAIDRRRDFDAAAELQTKPLKVGDSVLSHGDPCELTRIFVDEREEEPEEGWPCVLTFRDANGASEEKSYNCMFGKKAGSARLQRPPPTLAPPPRETRNDAADAETRRLVLEHAQELCAESPHKRDQKRRHVGPRLWITRAALILLMPVYALYAAFESKHPGLLKQSKFKELFNQECWHAIHAYREGCLCRACFNYRCYREALAVVAKLLLLLLEPPSMDADADNSPEGWQPDPDVKRLHAFCELTLMSDVGNELVCAPCLQDANAACIKGECSRCGFKMLWTKTLRPKLLDSYGKLKPDISRVWLTKMQWDRVKTGGDGSSSEDDLRQSREGTVIELLDELAPIQDTWVPHRFNIVNAKRSAQECEQNMMPGMVFGNSDFSENGEIVVKRAMQMEYWVIVYYTLLISINCILISSVWIDRESRLPARAEVTVELQGASVPGSLEAGAGSYHATVESGPNENGEYVVFDATGQRVTVPRELLRHRRMHRIAFIQITDDKTHDGFAAQAFAKRRLQFFQIWNDKGRAAALDFARNDQAEQKRRTDQAELDAAREAIVTNSASTAAASTAAASAASAASAAYAASDDDTDAAIAAANAAAAKTKAAEAAAVAAAAAIAAAARTSSSAYQIPVPRAARHAPSDAEFSAWLEKLDTEKFWAWIEHSDNAVHFKSKENLYFWSQQLDWVAFIRAIWVEFGCPGHGKGPWDGMGAMVKTKVSRDITNEQCRTPSGRIIEPICVAQHVRATFCTNEWLQEHAYPRAGR